MSDASALIADGDLPHGTPTLSITPPGTSQTAVVFVAEDISPVNPTTILESRDQNGVPSRQKFIQDFVTGTATLQLPTSTTIPPVNGATFTADLFKAGGTAPTWAVSNVSPRYVNNGETKVNIQFRKLINS